VLVNPTSGKGRGAAAGRTAADHLRRLGAEVRVHSGGSVEDARRHVLEAVEELPDALVVVGGDGTLASILEEVVESALPVALVPAGTGNDLARALGLPSDVAAAAELALRGRARPIDVCEATCVDGRAKYLTVAALGFDALVSERTNRLRWPHGRARYYLALLIELVRLRPLRFDLLIDGTPTGAAPGVLIAVGNTGSYGGGMPICPDADPGDGLLDVTHVAPIGRLRLLRLFPLLLKGQHLGRPEVRALRGSSVEVDAPGLVVYADGERVGTGAVRIDVLPGALRMFVSEAGP
jgi:diacylglycerol kinase (ATP)